MVLNAYDASAVEVSLVLREKFGGEVGVVLIGPTTAKETILRALAMGADSATHFVVENAETLDSYCFACILRDHFLVTPYDIILCGKQAQDTDAGLTGSMLAEMLGLPYASSAIGLDIADELFVVTRQGDTGSETITLSTPCLITCSNDMNEPRIPSLKGTMAARKKEITVISLQQLPAIMTGVVSLDPMPTRSRGELIAGESVDEQVTTLVDRLYNSAKVLQSLSA